MRVSVVMWCGDSVDSDSDFDDTDPAVSDPVDLILVTLALPTVTLLTLVTLGESGDPGDLGCPLGFPGRGRSDSASLPFSGSSVRCL